MTTTDYTDNIQSYNNKINNYEDQIVQLTRRIEELNAVKREAISKRGDCSDILIERCSRLNTISKYQNNRCVSS